MWHMASMSDRSRPASALASTLSVLTLAFAISPVLNGLESWIGMPTFSKASAVLTQRFPVDSQTALH